MKPIDLAKVFADLAADPNWPCKYVQDAYKKAYIEAQIDKARLALMVVEAKAPEWGLLDHTIRVLGIKPSDYANIKQRVEEAEG